MRHAWTCAGVALVSLACGRSTVNADTTGRPCTVVRTTAATADDSALVDSVCRVDVTRYALLTGRAAPPGSVFVGAPAVSTAWQSGHWTFRWPAQAQLRRIVLELGLSRAVPRSSPNSADQYMANMEEWMLPHEIGHAFDGARWGAAVFRIPAWYEEATAMWMEAPDSRRHRLQQAQDGAATAPPLDSVFRFVRPQVDPAGANFSRTETLVTGPCRGRCGPPAWKTRLITWRVGSDGKATSDTLYDDAVKASVTHGDSVLRYYTYSIAALYYVRARGGLTALHALAARIGPESGATDPLAGLAGIPPAGAARDADWRSWLRTAGAVQP